MELKAKFKVLKVKKKSSAVMFKGIKVGDIIEFMVPIARVNTSRGRNHAVDVRVENTRTGEITYKTFNRLDPIIDCFEFEEVTNEKN